MMSPEEISEGFKTIDALRDALENVLSSDLLVAAIEYQDLLKGETVNGMMLVEDEDTP